jgi:2-polyprenyl-6-methoxyphenol hydroxylase-like FAD-dependent oxidoreductase
LPGEILIVGGGVAALSTALACRARGISVRVFERGSEVRAGGGALVMWSNAMSVLRALGLAEQVLAEGTPIEECVFHTIDGKPLMEIPVGHLSREAGAPTVVLPRRALLGILARSLGPDAIAFGRCCERFEAGGGGVVVHFSDGSTAMGAGLVGADGLHSVVRQQLLGLSPPRSVHQTAWVGIVPRVHPGFPSGVMVGFVGDDLRFWATRIGSGSTYWYAIVKETASPRIDTQLRLVEALSTWRVPAADLVRYTPEADTVRTEIVDRPPSDVWGQGPTTLIGDAAHPMTPDLGQGACQAIEGSAVLAERLASAGDASAAFRGYERARMPRTRQISLVSRTIAEWSMPSFDVPDFLRHGILRLSGELNKLTRFESFRWIIDPSAARAR